jgi:hypothetical protein
MRVFNRSIFESKAARALSEREMSEATFATTVA